VVSFDLSDYSVIQPLLACTGLNTFHPFEYASFDYSGDARVAQVQNTLFTYLVGYRYVFHTIYHFWVRYILWRFVSYPFNPHTSHRNNPHELILVDETPCIDAHKTKARTRHFNNLLGSFGSFISMTRCICSIFYAYKLRELHCFLNISHCSITKSTIQTEG
jgi:hypothetical protein